MIRAYVGAGANLGDPVAQLEQAARDLDREEDIQVERRSSIYRSAALDCADDQPDYYNCVFELETALAAEQLLARLLEIESRHGRVRPGPINAPRPLDLDLLLYGQQVLDSDRLTLPHPRMHARAFVLYPLHELDPGLEIPGQGRVTELLPRVASQDIEKLCQQ